MEQSQTQTASTPYAARHPQRSPDTHDHSYSQIRSRITVVCAECKRLKLKCDRRSPCSSCTKRDTVARCIYSPAAAEKVDLHSLNNRLMLVEATLAQMTAGSFQSSYPPAHPQNVANANPIPPLPSSTANPAPGRNIPFPPNSHQHHHHPASVTTHVHDAPCPLALSLDELRSAWLDSGETGRTGRTALGRPPHPIKLEISSTDGERQMRLRAKLNSTTYPHSRHPNPQPFLPALSVYYPPISQPSYGSSSYTSVPSVTPAVLDLLPSAPACMRILARARPILAQRPVPLPGGWARFEQKAISLLSHRAGPSYSNVAGGSAQSSDNEAEVGRSERLHSAAKEKKKAEEGLPFFAITTAVLAIGASVSPPEVFGAENINAGFLHALSQQSLSVWESSSSRKPEKDYALYLVACLAGIGYLLLVTPDVPDDSQKDSDTGGKPKAIYSLVGKVVSIAREIGLGKEKAAWQEGDNEARPSSRPEARRAWEDFRRVIWWDVMFYDLFTSDALDHPSLIPPLSYSVKLPELNGNLYDPATKKYIIARCRLVQLAQTVKHRLSHPDCCCGYTFDQATALEDEVRRWSRESLSQDDDEKVEDRRHAWELTLVAQVLILRAYIPFLISAVAAKKPANGLSAPGKLTGKPGLSDKPQIQGNAMAMATQSCLGAAQMILRLGNKLNVSLFKEPGSTSSIVGPILLDLYPLERMVLDAVVITQSSTAVSVVSEAEVRRGLEIMIDREFALGKERREIWETMKQRVLTPGKLQIPSQGIQLSAKRKHDQLSPVVTNSTDITQHKKDGLPSKYAKTSPAALPIFGVRVRQGRMGPSGPIHSTGSEYERRTGTPRNFTSNVQSDAVVCGQMSNTSELQQQHPIPQRHSNPYMSSPTDFSSEQTSLQHAMSVDHPVPGHRNSLDQTQPKGIYGFEEASLPHHTYSEYASNISTAHTSSTSSSPYQTTPPSYHPAQFGSPDNSSNRTPTSQVNADSPTISFNDGQGSGNQPSGSPPKFGPPDPRPPFENPRPTFMTENPQPQVFDKMPPPNFSPGDGVQSPTLNGAPAENSVGESTSSQFGVPPSDASHSSTGYFHSGGALGSYDNGGMLPLGMRMEDSVPGTPIYEKPHMMYENKPSHHQMLQHGGHSISVSGHGPPSMVSNSFVGDQAQGLGMGGGSQPPHQSWTPAPPPQPLVGVPTGQPYW